MISKLFISFAIFFISINLLCYNRVKLEYADFLYSSKQYDLAVSEYYRGMYNGTYEDTIQAYFSIADCFIKTQKYIEAVRAYEQIENRDNRNWTAIRDHVKLLNNMQYFYESNKVIDKFKSQFPLEEQDTLRLYNVINHINLNEFDKAKTKLQLITTGYPKYRAGLIDEIMNSELPLRYKSKPKAALMQAIIPGSGYFYCKMPQTAFATIIVNSLMGYVTYDNFRNRNYGSGVFFSVLGTSFYLGSIYGSIQAASKYNKREFEKFSNKIKF